MADYDSICLEAQDSARPVEDGLVLMNMSSKTLLFRDGIMAIHVLLCAIEPDDEIWQASADSMISPFSSLHSEDNELDEIYIQDALCEGITGAPFNDPNPIHRRLHKLLVYQPISCLMKTG